MIRRFVEWVLAHLGLLKRKPVDTVIVTLEQALIIVLGGMIIINLLESMLFKCRVVRKRSHLFFWH